ncbi:hypothetical protein [Salipiger aestuarii]|uniref:hypothetical protein n=1 Tax=Salipiger aestuarii TaxID=568098 RepID=UPI00123B5C43|nr:hypothetical protein [Salipiger aestuarii]
MRLPGIPAFAALCATPIASEGAVGMKTDPIGRQKFAVQDSRTMGPIANRILVQVDGPDETTEGPRQKAALATMDFAGVANFGN